MAIPAMTAGSQIAPTDGVPRRQGPVDDEHAARCPMASRNGQPPRIERSVATGRRLVREERPDGRRDDAQQDDPDDDRR